MSRFLDLVRLVLMVFLEVNSQVIHSEERQQSIFSNITVRHCRDSGVLLLRRDLSLRMRRGTVL